MIRLVLLAAFLLGWTTEAGAAASHVVMDFNKFLTPGQYRGSFHLDDRERQFLIITPQGAKPDEPRPIVFFFHGAGGSAQQAAATYGWVEKARAERFFAVFPDGLPVRPDGKPDLMQNPRVWRDERGSMPSAVNDVAFFATLLDKLETVLPIDRRRVFVTGFSNGGAMTFTLGAHFPRRISAIAPVSSQSFTRAESLARPLPVYYLVGTADPLVPFAGGTATMPWLALATTPPVTESAEQWARLDGCPVRPETVSDRDGVQVLRYGPGSHDTEMLYTIVTGNGHHWPGTIEPLPPALSGPTRDPFSATDHIWEFFQHHPLPTAPPT